ncbi:MAG: hypothetical protein QJR00_03850, partial [Bacillota bacterium]|nr:hypothetical protein [Bacillota bacterium]
VVLVPESGVSLQGKGLFPGGRETLGETGLRVYSSQELLPGTLVQLRLAPTRPPWLPWILALVTVLLLLWGFLRRYRRSRSPR